MIVRCCVTCLLIAVLLACPYVCFSEIALPAGHEVGAHGCRCCQPPQAPESCPDRDDCDGAGACCLCGGAIVLAAAKAADADPHFATPLASLEASSTPQFPAAGCDLDALHATHFPPLSSGRDVRALIASYLL